MVLFTITKIEKDFAMNKNYKINQKINFSSESKEKQDQIISISAKIHDVMKKRGLRESSASDIHIDYVFSIGGDGTMLHAMHENINKESLVIGINAGNVGFLTPYNISDVMDESLFSFMDKDARPRIEKRCILEYGFEGKRIGAVNEYAFTAGHPNFVIDFMVESESNGIVSKAGHYKANTLLISTPSGSTAYNMNAGGAIISPSMRAMQMLMIAPTVLGNRPLIFPENDTLHITFKTDIQIFSDGILTSQVPAGERISISLMKKDSNILLPDEWNFYGILSKKLHWNNGQDVE